MRTLLRTQWCKPCRPSMFCVNIHLSLIGSSILWTPSYLDPWNVATLYSGHFEKSQRRLCNSYSIQVPPLKWGHSSNQDTLICPKCGRIRGSPQQCSSCIVHDSDSSPLRGVGGMPPFFFWIFVSTVTSLCYPLSTWFTYVLKESSRDLSNGELGDFIMPTHTWTSNAKKIVANKNGYVGMPVVFWLKNPFILLSLIQTLLLSQ